MKTLKFLVLLTSIFALILVTGCKKDDDPEPVNMPQYEVKTVEVPEVMAQSSDQGAQMTAAYISMVNSMSGYGAMMIPPSKSSVVTNLKVGGVETYTWTFEEGSDNFTITLTVEETSNKYYWKMEISGFIEGSQINNFTYMEAEEAKDGSSGKFTVYDWEEQGVMMETIWTEDGNGTFNFTFEVPNEILLSMVSYTDGSGSIEFKDWYNNQWLLEFAANWDATGHGQWWEYDEGILYAEGTW